MDSRGQLNVLAGAVHGTVCALNFLCFAYNALQGHRKRALLHLGIAVYEARAVHLHVQEAKCAKV